MDAASRSPAEPPLGEQAIAQGIADAPSPISQFDDGLDGGGSENANAVARAHLYAILTGRSDHELYLHLDRHPSIRETLGLSDDTLSRSAINYSKNAQFDGYDDYLADFAEYVYDRLFDRYPGSLVEPHLVKLEEPERRESLPEIPEAAIDEKIRHVRAIMLEETDFDRLESRTQYDDASILDPFLEAAQEGDAPANVIADNDHDMAIKTAFNAVKQRDGPGWNEEFHNVNDRIVNAAIESGMLQGELEAYIDNTTIPIWPTTDDPPEGHRQGEPKKGTTYGFVFSTLVVHDDEHDKDVVAAVEPYTQDLGPYDLVERLLDRADDRLDITDLRLDSGFESAAIIRLCRERDIGFSVRLKRRGDELKGALAAMSGRFDDYENYPVTSSDRGSSEKVRVVTEPDWNNANKSDFDSVISNSQQSLDAFSEDEKPDVLDLTDTPDILWKARRPYGTLNYDDSARRVVRRHKQRWRVENSYADQKTKLLARTKSRHHGVRVFLFWLATVLYNGWMLTRKFLREDFPDHRPTDRGAVQLTTFVRKILRLNYG